MMPPAIRQCDRVAGLGDGREARHDAARDPWNRQQSHGDFRDDDQHAFRADHEWQQVQSWRLRPDGADVDSLAIARVAANAHEVLQGHAVLEAVDAAGILGDVAADRAGNLAGGVRRVEQAMGTRGLRDGEVRDARLHGSRPCPGIDPHDPVKSRQRQQETILARQRPARQAGTRAPGHDRHPESIA